VRERRVGNLGRFHEALDEPRRERFKRGAAERLGSPLGRFRLTATAWYVRGTAPAGYRAAAADEGAAASLRWRCLTTCRI
jgi:hypothetical protein